MLARVKVRPDLGWGRGSAVPAGTPKARISVALLKKDAAGDWHGRQVSADEAVSAVRPGDKVFVGSACATPRTLVNALEELRRPGVVLVHFLINRGGTGDPLQ